MKHEYPRDPAFDSVSERRVDALARFGFTQRQREFLVTVMVHAGCFLERQYCAFTGTGSRPEQPRVRCPPDRARIRPSH